MSRPLANLHWLRDPFLKRHVMVRAIMSTQALEGRMITELQAEAAYDTVQAEKDGKLVALANRAHDQENNCDFEIDIAFLLGAITATYDITAVESLERYQATIAVQKWV